MKTITIKQPYATLIAEGVKEYEFRTWKTAYRGEILIHAGKGIDKNDMEKYKHLGYEYPSGCIIAKAIISDCIIIDEEARNMLKEKNAFVYENRIKDKSWQGYGLKIENVKKIEPIPASGKLSFWEFNYPQTCGKKEGK